MYEIDNRFEDIRIRFEYVGADLEFDKATGIYKLIANYIEIDDKNFERTVEKIVESKILDEFIAELEKQEAIEFYLTEDQS